MSLSYLLTALLAVSTASLAVSAPAYAWRMSGIDTQLQLAPGVSSVTLYDKNRAPLTVVNGVHRLRFSIASSSFHIMANPQHIQEFAVVGGFPNNNLQNFFLPGSRFGNDVDLDGSTRDALLDTRRYYDRESCSYTCGYDRICSGDPRRPVCRTVPRTCYSQREYENIDELIERSFRMTMTDTFSRMYLGEFNGVVSRGWVNRYRRIIYDGCRY